MKTDNNKSHSFIARGPVQELICLVVATRNKGKIAEIKNLLQGFPVILKDLTDFGPIPPIPEDGETFEDNAYLKASFTARILGYPAIADDSGLVVEALEGAPGILSARYAGEDADDEERCRRILKEMNGKTNRKAAFHCVISIAVPTGPALTYEGRCEGLITKKPEGKQGFGYDPIFFYPPLGKTFAQMSMDEKNRVSHRGKVLLEIQSEVNNILIWIRRHMPIEEKFPCATD
jgi:XTP/dITP diphosphohydrolase